MNDASTLGSTRANLLRIAVRKLGEVGFVIFLLPERQGVHNALHMSAHVSMQNTDMPTPPKKETHVTHHIGHGAPVAPEFVVGIVLAINELELVELHLLL